MSASGRRPASFRSEPRSLEYLSLLTPSSLDTCVRAKKIEGVIHSLFCGSDPPFSFYANFLYTFIESRLMDGRLRIAGAELSRSEIEQ